MSDHCELMKRLIDAVAEQVLSHTDELTDLDQAIGDGDHGLNMKRGFSEVQARRDEICAKPLADALKAVGTTLVMKVGGASGPLYGTLFLGLGKGLAGVSSPNLSQVESAFGQAIEAVMKRGKSQPGQKTMLDVLVPVHRALADGAGLAAVKQRARDAARATIPMLAIKGRASFLGERSIGHMDPGARSSELLICTVIDTIEENL